MKEALEKKTHSRFEEVITRSALFAGASAQTRASLERSGYFKKVAKGTRLFFRGDPADYFYLLVSGEVVISLTSPDGRELIINVIKAGDFFGELGLLTNKPRSADAVVRQAAEMLVIPRQAFIDALQAEPKLTYRMLEATADRLGRSSDFQNSLAFLDAQSRLARLLLELDSQNEERGYITISQEELAQRAGLIRQTVAKTLGQWRRNGWLLTGRGHIVLLNRKALRLWFDEQTGEF